MTGSDTRGVAKESGQLRGVFSGQLRHANLEQSATNLEASRPASRLTNSINQGSKRISRNHVLLALLYSPSVSTTESFSNVLFPSYPPIDENVRLTIFADSSSPSSF